MAILNKNTFDNWLKIYFKAWIDGNPQLIIDTFSIEGKYNETPFTNHMNGKDEIYKYWKENAQQSQENVIAHYQIITVKEKTGFAKWQTQFDRKGKGIHVKLDGIMEVIFSNEFLVDTFNEWWHQEEIRIG